MQELARLAAVDVSTVSRALNDSPLVKPATKATILKLAEERGYAVNISARNLRRQSAQTLGIVIPLGEQSEQNISDPFFLEIVSAISRAAAAKDYDLIISLPETDDQSAERRLLRTGRVDGLIVIGQAGRLERLDKVAELWSNVVVWGGRMRPRRYTFVGSDNELGGRLAGEHLISVGRTQILFIGNLDLPEVRLRYDGLVAALGDAGLEHDQRLVLKSDFTAMTAFSDMIEFIDSGPEFDAVFAASDVLAMNALHALRARSIDVPKDVSVVGYDNIGQSALTTPGLTTIDQNIAQGGELLVSLLIRKINGERVRSRITDTKLIVRGSSVP